MTNFIKWINALLGDLKTTTNGTYQPLDFSKYRFRYLVAAHYRLNRHRDLSTIFVQLLRAEVTTSKRTEARMRLAGDQR